MRKLYGSKVVQCEFCLLAFKTNAGRLRDGRGKFCCNECKIKGRILRPFRQGLVKQILAEREAIRKLVKERGLDRLDPNGRDS